LIALFEPQTTQLVKKVATIDRVRKAEDEDNKPIASVKKAKKNE
jgi:hypothetical protein